jgi:glucose-6-phosphate dehydrogenase assembly protein OpcA
VTEDLWVERGTTPSAIEAALRRLLRERHAANEGLAPARVLNLVVVVDREWKGEISNRLQRVGRYHPSRTVLCSVEDGRQTLDARVVMSYEEPSSSGLGVIREQVEIDMGPDHLARLDTIIDPVLAPELGTMLWSPHGHDDVTDTLLGIVDVILLDSDDVLDPPDAFERATTLLRSCYVVDLAWLRTTPWRERLAATFDPPDRICELTQIERLAIRHARTSTASALLLAGWLSSRLGWEAQPLAALNGDGLEGAVRDVGIRIEPVAQEVPGLAGVTVGCTQGYELALDRGPGGLRAREVRPGAEERQWRVLGASRGEAGILGEGVRQALLRDPTYGPALEAARRLRP